MFLTVSSVGEAWISQVFKLKNFYGCGLFKLFYNVYVSRKKKNQFFKLCRCCNYQIVQV